MSGIIFVLRSLHHGENTLANDLLAAADRHRAEHEFHHLATHLAGWSRQHGELLGKTAKEYGAELPAPGESEEEHLPALRKNDAGRTEHHPIPGLLLLRDLKDIYLGASENSLHWEMLAQAARASKDDRILNLSSNCHPQTLRQIRWANTLIKALSPQLLNSITSC